MPISQQLAKKCENIAASYLNRVPGIVWQQSRGLWGNSFLAEGGEKVLEAPTPNTPAKLHIFLHELLHWHYNDPDPKGDGSGVDESDWKSCKVRHSDFYEEARVDKESYDIMKHHGVEWTRSMWDHAAYNIQHAKRRSKKCAHVDSRTQREFADAWLALCKANSK